MAKTIDWDDRIGAHIKLRDLRVFFAAVECGSMAKAAALFRITQPAVSQAIVQLEHGAQKRQHRYLFLEERTFIVCVLRSYPYIEGGTR